MEESIKMGEKKNIVLNPVQKTAKANCAMQFRPDINPERKSSKPGMGSSIHEALHTMGQVQQDLNATKDVVE